jgi:hypothetical protein
MPGAPAPPKTVAGEIADVHPAACATTSALWMIVASRKRPSLV